MAKDIDIWNGDIVLSEVMEILHTRVQNLSFVVWYFKFCGKIVIILNFCVFLPHKKEVKKGSK